MEKMTDKVKEFAGLVAAATGFKEAGEPCIDSATLIRYALCELAEDVNREVRAHLLYCDACAEEVAILWQIRNATRLPSYKLQEARERLRELRESLEPPDVREFMKAHRERAADATQDPTRPGTDRPEGPEDPDKTDIH